MKRALPVAALLLAALPAPAQDSRDAARAQAEQIAVAIDTDRDGTLSLSEIETYGTAVFDRLDSDGDDRMTRADVAAFRFGMTDIAEFRDRMQAYNTAQTILFDVFDHDHDGFVSRQEHESGFRRAYGFADLDEDGTLTMQEYGEGFIFNIAMRAALDG